MPGGWESTRSRACDAHRATPALRSRCALRLQRVVSSRPGANAYRTGRPRRCRTRRGEYTTPMTSPVAVGSMIQSVLRPPTLDSSPRQISKAGCWIARANENDNAQGGGDLKFALMAFKRAKASSLDWPPHKNAIPGTAAGTARKRHLTVATATSSTASCLGQVNPGSTIVGFRSIPYSITRCV